MRRAVLLSVVRFTIKEAIQPPDPIPFGSNMLGHPIQTVVLRRDQLGKQRVPQPIGLCGPGGEQWPLTMLLHCLGPASLPHTWSSALRCHQPVTKALGCLVVLPKCALITRTITLGIHKVVGIRASMGAQGGIEVPQDPRLRRTSCSI